jgi:nucleoside-diphosphate-sugar epimerase
MKALVTGGAGFIGSNIVGLLIEKGYFVRVLDNLSTGYFQNLNPYIQNENFQFIGGDVRDFKSVKKAMKDIDVVFHLAASVGRQRSLDYPQLDSKINLIGTINILEAMRTYDVKKIIYSSSAAIFGELQESTIDETHPQNADSPYGISKLAAEKMILAYNDLYSMSGICLRYFNIYGINQRFDLYGNVIPIFVKQILSNEKLTIYGDGKQIRDFVYVSDIAQANFLASKSNESGVFNIGSGNSISINELADLMQKIAGIECPIQYVHERKADVKHCRANAKKILDRLGFKTNITLCDGLQKYINWYNNNCMGKNS